MPDLNAEAAALRRVRRLARVLDDSIPVPGTPWRIGIDPLIGLLPGVGDAIGVVLSGWIVVQAYRLDVPARDLGKMVGTLGVEAIVGWIPGVGDLFDAGFKANARNARLLEKRLSERSAASKAQPLVADESDRGQRRLLLLAAGVTVVTGTLLSAAAGVALWRMLSG